MKLFSEKRTSDWIAYLEANREIYEVGTSEAEALGKLIKRLQEDFGARLDFSRENNIGLL